MEVESVTIREILHPKLVEYFVVVGAKDPSHKPPEDYYGEVLDIYPPPDETLTLRDVAMFCYPATYKTYSANQRESFNSFVLTNAVGDKLYGYSLTFTEKVTFLSSTLSTSSSTTTSTTTFASTTSSTSINTPPVVYYPKSICILSAYLQLSFFRSYLVALYRPIQALIASGSSQDFASLAIEAHLSSLFQLPSPTPFLSFSLSSTLSSSFVLSPPTHLSLSLAPLFRTFDLSNIFRLLKLLLSEKKLLFISNSASSSSQLSLLAFSLFTLLFPFTWLHVFIPILPHKLIECIEAPIPFVMGISQFSQSEIESQIDAKENDFYLIDIEWNSIKKCGNGTDDDMEFPKRLEEETKKNIKRILTPDLCETDWIGSTLTENVEKRFPTWEDKERQIRLLIFKFLMKVTFGDLLEGDSIISSSNSTISINSASGKKRIRWKDRFDQNVKNLKIEEFGLSQKEQHFYDNFLQTQMYMSYIKERDSVVDGGLDAVGVGMGGEWLERIYGFEEDLEGLDAYLLDCYFGNTNLAGLLSFSDFSLNSEIFDENNNEKNCEDLDLVDDEKEEERQKHYFQIKRKFPRCLQKRKFKNANYCDLILLIDNMISKVCNSVSASDDPKELNSIAFTKEFPKYAELVFLKAQMQWWNSDYSKSIFSVVFKLLSLLDPINGRDDKILRLKISQQLLHRMEELDLEQNLEIVKEFSELDLKFTDFSDYQIFLEISGKIISEKTRKNIIKAEKEAKSRDLQKSNLSVPNSSSSSSSSSSGGSIRRSREDLDPLSFYLLDSDQKRDIVQIGKNGRDGLGFYVSVADMLAEVKHLNIKQFDKPTFVRFASKTKLCADIDQAQKLYGVLQSVTPTKEKSLVLGDLLNFIHLLQQTYSTSLDFRNYLSAHFPAQNQRKNLTSPKPIVHQVSAPQLTLHPNSDSFITPQLSLIPGELILKISSVITNSLGIQGQLILTSYNLFFFLKKNNLIFPVAPIKKICSIHKYDYKVILPPGIPCLQISYNSKKIIDTPSSSSTSVSTSVSSSTYFSSVTPNSDENSNGILKNEGSDVYCFLSFLERDSFWYYLNEIFVGSKIDRQLNTVSLVQQSIVGLILAETVHKLKKRTFKMFFKFDYDVLVHYLFGIPSCLSLPLNDCKSQNVENDNKAKEDEKIINEKDVDLLGKTLVNLVTQAWYVNVEEEGKIVKYVAAKECVEWKVFAEHTKKLKLIDWNRIQLSEKAKKSFWINIYNVLVIHAFIVSEFQFTGNYLEWRFLAKSGKYNIGGLLFSLDDIESGILRCNSANPWMIDTPFFDGKDGKIDDRLKMAVNTVDPRIHAALTRHMKTSPYLRTYDCDTVEDSLNKAMEEYCGLFVKVDLPNRKLMVSEVFKWYRADFGVCEEKDIEELFKHTILAYLEGSKKNNLKLMLEDGRYALRYRYNWRFDAKPFRQM